MVCRLFGAKPLPEPVLAYCQLDSNRNSIIFIHENAFETVVCEMAAILSRPQCVKPIYRWPFIILHYSRISLPPNQIRLLLGWVNDTLLTQQQNDNEDMTDNI